MIQEFKTYLIEVKGYSTNTAAAYEKDLRTFVRFCKEYDTSARWSTISREHLDAYLSYQYKRGLKPATTNRHLASIGALYNYMKRQGYKIDNPSRFESRRKIEKTEPNTIPVEDIKKAASKMHGPLKIITLTLLHTGIRIQELLDITRQDLDVQNNIIKIHGKGKKQRLVYTTPENMKDLVREAGQRRLDAAIFGSWTQEEVRRAMYIAMRPETAAPQVSPHAIRHTFATETAKAGANAPALAKMLGHESIKTTQRYIDSAQIPAVPFWMQ